MDGYVFRAQLTRVSPIGITPDGLRLDIGFAGTISEGALAGRAIDGVDYLLIRPDGIGVVDARELISSDERPATCVHAAGYIVAPFPMPELSVLADPNFTWPDRDLPMHGSSLVQTADSELDAANHTVYGWNGAVNVAQGTLEVRARSLADLLAAAAI